MTTKLIAVDEAWRRGCVQQSGGDGKCCIIGPMESIVCGV